MVIWTAGDLPLGHTTFLRLFKIETFIHLKIYQTHLQSSLSVLVPKPLEEEADQKEPSRPTVCMQWEGRMHIP